MSILVLGATGTIGPHVVRGLLARDETVHVATRDAGRASQILPAGVVVLEGDPEHDDFLLAAATGAETVFLPSSHRHRMADMRLLEHAPPAILGHLTPAGTDSRVDAGR
ncbi:SDR family oxidoreductase [Amycolatopsis sp. cmx-8-4]|uniref:SDR family oxidoreductase n=1 Tax=Amycolatopsis sp. cmx-8-4 TaxID=2790947 RepID=UPI00397BB805